MKQVSRRTFLHAAGLAAAASAAMGFRFSPNQAVPTSVLGFSQAGQPLAVYHYGGGPTRLFIMGAQHGGPEGNTAELVKGLMWFLDQNPGEIPPGVAIDMMPEMNVDGLAIGSRQYLSGVDPNRNWDGPGWESDAYDSNGRFVRGLGGPEPMSEQETKALAQYLYWTHPLFVVNYHCSGNFMFGGGEGIQDELAWLYSQASGYRLPGAPAGGGGGGAAGRLGYRVSGAINGWLRGQGIGNCLIELSNPWDPEYERNLRGFQALLGRLRPG